MIEKVSTFKDRLNEAIEIRGIKPVDLSRRTNISEATISQYRSGYAEPKSKRLVKIANALYVDPTWLMGVDVPMEIEPEEYDYSGRGAALIHSLRYDEDLREAVALLSNLSEPNKAIVIQLIHVLSKSEGET